MSDTQQDPLAALEELLKDSKGGGDAAGAADEAKVAEEKKLAEEQAVKEKQDQEIQSMQDEQKQEDAEDLREQISDLKSIANTPEEKARLAQIEKARLSSKKLSDHQEEYEIVQLGHKKI